MKYYFSNILIALLSTIYLNTGHILQKIKILSNNILTQSLFVNLVDNILLFNKPIIAESKLNSESVSQANTKNNAALGPPLLLVRHYSRFI